MTPTTSASLAVAVSLFVGQAAAWAADPSGTACPHQERLEQAAWQLNVGVAGAAVDLRRPAGALAGADVVFSDDFDDGDISDWTVTTTEDARFEVSTAECVSSPYSVYMQSMGIWKATGVSPSYSLDLVLKYKVSFFFLVPHADNHWFEVFNNHHIYLVIDEGTDLKGYKASLRTVYPIATLDVDEWYLVELEANPAADTYDVYLDGQFKTTCPMWVHSGWETEFRIGDRADGSTDKGEAYWDDFVITQGPLGDMDYDGDVDLDDFAIFAEALSGPGQPIVPPADPAADLDWDDDADLADFAAFQVQFTG